MLKHMDHEFAGSMAAEAPSVITYIVALVLLALVWSNFDQPTADTMDLGSAATAKNAKN